MEIIKGKYIGYTFMELILCLGVIMILGSGAGIAVNHYYSASRYDLAKADLSVIAMAVSKYRFEIGSYPDNLEVLAVRQVPHGPWITLDALKDPWGNTYQYSYDTDRYALWSNGENEVNQSGNPLDGGFSGDDIGEIRK